MSQTITQARSAISELMDAEDDQLFTELGIRACAMERDPNVAGSFTPNAAFDGTSMGPLDTVKELGQRLFKRWNVEAYKLLCGDNPDDEKTRDEIKSALSLGDAAFGAALASALISTFGLAPALAAVIGAILVKRFFKPAHEEVCAVWKTKL
jgi:hypothetical protein